MAIMSTPVSTGTCDLLYSRRVGRTFRSHFQGDRNARFNRRCLTGARLCVRNYAHISFFPPLRDVTTESQLFSVLPQWLTHRYALHARVCFYCCSCAYHGAGQQAEQGRRSKIEPHDGFNRMDNTKERKPPSGFGSESANRGWKKDERVFSGQIVRKVCRESWRDIFPLQLSFLAH